MKNFIDIKDFTAEEITELLNSAIENKNQNAISEKLLSGKNLILFFEKNSTRTRLSFDLAVKQLGGSSIILNGSDIHLSSGKESLSDTIKTFSLYSDGVVMRVNNHQTILDTLEVSSVPIMNGLSNLSHPCQCMAGLMTLIEEKGSLENLNITWFGPITNVAHSWIEAYSKNLGFKLSIFSPDRSKDLYLSKISKHKENINVESIIYNQIDDEILSTADVIMTDTWQSMGEKSDENVIKELNGFRVTKSLMDKAKDDCIFTHCLPANRGQEVEESVIDGANSRIWEEASNRLHIQKQILRTLI